MIKKILLPAYICLLGILPLRGQNITVTEQNEAFTVSEKQKEFYYIEKDFPLTDDRWLAITNIIYTQNSFLINLKVARHKLGILKCYNQAI